MSANKATKHYWVHFALLTMINKPLVSRLIQQELSWVFPDSNDDACFEFIIQDRLP